MSCKRALAGFGMVALSAGMLGLGAAPAGAAKVTVGFDCHAFLLKADGSLGIEVPPSISPPPHLDISFQLDGPSEVNAGSTFNAVAPSTSQDVPDKNGTNTIIEVKNIVSKVTVTGATHIGTPILSGGTVVNPTATVSGNTITVTFPGNKTGSQHPGSGNLYFQGGTSFMSPKITIPITAGAAGTTIKSNFTDFETNSVVLLGTSAVAAGVRNCSPSTSTLIGQIPVVSPPGADAPDAIADNATTDAGKSVTIDVLANDKRNKSFPIDKGSLTIVSDPGHGSAKVNADHTVTYTPDSGFSGADTFMYQVCSALPEATTTTTEAIETPQAAVQEPTAVFCDKATVTVTVNAPTPVTTAAAQTTVAPTTVAAAAELPRTGSSSTPLAMLGLGLLVSGLAATGYAKSRRRSATH